jgi:hypothetical protein
MHLGIFFSISHVSLSKEKSLDSLNPRALIKICKFIFIDKETSGWDFLVILI